ncbi:putative glycoside hydrolase [Thermoclostridium stercorarium]|uniref:putative glycoside hydrolase n=1 Tax=Thermoclostridium stercorarium TaxID=1510 RepID=UPI000A818FE6|nr:putative glycoside hydrolase [Thermoclostridium stercorarium]
MTRAGNGSGVYWLDATRKESWDYILAIVREAIDFGFDEIQFDYVRFPETSLYKYELANLEEGKERHEYIEEFLAYIRKNVPEGTILSADIFGMPLISSKDYGEIGQTLESIGWNLDYISPMIYPSHFANSAPRGSMANGVGQVINGIKFTHPDLYPYEVVYNTLMVGKRRIESVDGYNVKCRPYIQGFTADYLPEGYWKKYGVEEYRAQIQAVYDAGYEEWIFWNARNNYVEEAFLPEGQ